MGPQEDYSKDSDLHFSKLLWQKVYLYPFLSKGYLIFKVSTVSGKSHYVFLNSLSLLQVYNFKQYTVFNTKSKQYIYVTLNIQILKINKGRSIRTKE